MISVFLHDMFLHDICVLHDIRVFSRYVYFYTICIFLLVICVFTRYLCFYTIFASLHDICIFARYLNFYMISVFLHDIRVCGNLFHACSHWKLNKINKLCKIVNSNTGKCNIENLRFRSKHPTAVQSSFNT